jgi:hypothetical protein
LWGKFCLLHHSALGFPTSGILRVEPLPSRLFFVAVADKKEVLHLCELLFHFRLYNSFSFQFLIFVALFNKTKRLVVESFALIIWYT